MLCSLYIFAGNLSSSSALLELSHQLTTAPDYLLKSSLLTKHAEQLTDRSTTALHCKEPSSYEGSRKFTQVCLPSTQDGRSVKSARIEHTLLSSQLASSLTENRLLKQLEPQNVSQKMSQLCVMPSLLSKTKEDISDACSTAVMSSVPSKVTSTILVSKSVQKQQKKACDTKGMPLIEKPKPKHVKKVKLAASEPVNSDEVVSSFELPNYELMHEDVKDAEVGLFVPPEKEEMADQLMRPVVDLLSVKVVIRLLSA